VKFWGAKMEWFFYVKKKQEDALCNKENEIQEEAAVGSTVLLSLL
jgi:hypothetical protein